jgi:adenosine kinase
MDIIVSGSIAYDYLMRFPGRFAEHLLQEQLHRLSISFLVEDMTRHWGGVAANIAYTLGLMNMRPKLFGTAGRDFSDYRVWLENAGVDTSTVRQLDDVFCASFFVNTDLDNNQIASFYSGAMARAREFSLRDVYTGQPDFIIISPNDPLAMKNLAAECRQNGIPFIYDPSQQVPRLSGDELLQGLDGAAMMIVNAYEAEMISSKTGLDIDDLRARIGILVITHGRDGSEIYADGDKVSVPVFPVPKEDIQDPTGVGDAYRAGFICGLAHRLPLRICGEIGSLCAAYVLEKVGPQSHTFTLADFVSRYRQAFDDAGQLDILLKPAAV